MDFQIFDSPNYQCSFVKALVMRNIVVGVIEAMDGRRKERRMDG